MKKEILISVLIGTTLIVVTNKDIIIYGLDNFKTENYAVNTVAKRGLIEEGGKTYYIDEKGNKVTGWYNVGNDRYFFDPKEGGAAHEGIYKDGSTGDIYFNEKGVMQQGIFKSGDNRYFLALKNGNGQNAYIKYGFYTDPSTKKRYYFNPENHGEAVIGWYNGDSTGVSMYFKKDGSMAEGITKIDNEYFLFLKDSYNKNPENAYLSVGWYTDPSSSKRYYFRENGQSCDIGKAFIGWYHGDSAGTMYFDKNGVMADGIVKIDGRRYLFLRNGYGENAYKKTDWYTDRATGNRYYFDPSQDGKAFIGWYYGDPAGTMYFHPDGTMAKGTVKIEDSYYVFNEKNGNYYTNKPKSNLDL